MRTFRLSLAGAVVLVLLGGVGSVLLAQDEAASLDPLRASVFTLSPSDSLKDPEWVSGPGPDGSTEYLGMEWVAPVEASDSRISGTWTEIYGLRGWPAPDDTGLPYSPSVTAGAVRVDNEGGAWVGTLGGFGSAFSGHEWIQLQGEGAYEGLTALIEQSWDSTTGAQTYEGAIIPGVLLDYPDPIPAAERLTPAE